MLLHLCTATRILVDYDRAGKTGDQGVICKFTNGEQVAYENTSSGY